MQGYDAVATVQAAIDALEDDNPTAPTDPTQPTDPTEPEGETPVPETGDGLPAVALLLTLIACRCPAPEPETEAKTKSVNKCQQRKAAGIPASLPFFMDVFGDGHEE